MKIRSMTATFGKLQKATLELGDGLNIITAPNEGGKSTWCAFLRAMFYGIPTRERDTKTTIAEKNRYQPWGGGKMEGTVELEWQGRSITLRRSSRGSVPFGSFSAVYTGTEESVPGLTGENCGEILLGVSRSVFERTAFVGQGGAVLSADSELERRIAALVSSGEEKVSYSQAEGRLKEWQRRRKHNKSGLIPRLEEELEHLREALRRQESARQQEREAQGEKLALIARREAVEEKLRLWRQRSEGEKRRRWQEAQAALEKAGAQVSELERALGATPDPDTLRRAQGDLAYLNTLEANRRMAERESEQLRAGAEKALAAAEDPLFSGLTPEQAWEQAVSDRERSAEKAPGAPLWMKIAVPALLLLGAAGLTWGVLERSAVLCAAAGGIPILAGCLAALVGALGLSRARRRHEETVAALLSRYGAAAPEDIPGRAGAYRERYTAAQEALRRTEAAENAARDLGAQKETLTASLLELVHTFAPEVTDLFGVSAAISRALGLEEKLAEARARLEGARRLAESLERPSDPDAESLPPLTGELDREEGSALARELRELDGRLSEVGGALAMAQGELRTLGDPDLTEERMGEAEEELRRRREEYEAISLALEVLTAANARLQERFSPAINAEAGKILEALTAGRYGSVALTREMEASAQEKGSVLPRRALELSQGTAEQLYLAVRLAICRLTLPQGAPLVLDDALDPFDQERMEKALGYLEGWEGQVLLFTCHRREAQWGRERSGVRVTALQTQ